jgi:hypothetical protein
MTQLGRIGVLVVLALAATGAASQNLRYGPGVVQHRLRFLSTIAPPPKVCMDAKITDGDAYATSMLVRRLPSGTYNVANNAAANTPPDPTTFQPLALTDQEEPFLADAFDNAPAELQTLLCDGSRTLLVDDDDQVDEISGWSLWFPGGTTMRYIGISHAFLKNPPQLSDFENILLSGLLHNTDTTIHTPIAVNTDADSVLSMSVLGVIAHEMGHILYYEKDVPNWMNCGTTSKRFAYGSWRKDDSRIPRGFHGPGIEFNADLTISDPESKPSGIAADLQQNTPTHFRQAARKLQRIYGADRQPAKWADLFAVVARDEDFVETYRLMVLQRAQFAPLSSMSMSIGYSAAVPLVPIDVAANLRRVSTGKADVLPLKVACIVANALLSPLP